MVALARKTLQYEWRRYLPAMIAIAFAGVLLFVQTALVFGIFATSSVLITASTADLWIGYPQTPSVELGRRVPAVAEMRLKMDPDIERVDELQWLDASWHAPGRQEHIAVIVTGINPATDGMLLARVLPTALRMKLVEPDTIIVDPADVDKLGVSVGEYGFIQGRKMRLVGLASGLRSLGAVTVATSAATSRTLGAAASSGHGATYFLARLHSKANAAAVQQRLQNSFNHNNYEVWTAEQFRRRTTLFWLFDTGAGLGFIFAAVLVFLVGTVIASQALAGAMSGLMRDFAMLRAMGITRGELARVVLAQSSWLGGAGLLLAALLSGLVVVLARTAAVPIAPSVPTSLGCALGLILVSWASGLASLTRVTGTDPSELLRA